MKIFFVSELAKLSIKLFVFRKKQPTINAYKKSNS